MPRAIVLLLVVLAVCGCSFLEREPRVVDGWPIGDRVDCSARTDCGTLADTAAIELGRAEPDHAQVVDWTLHEETYYVDPRTGDKILSTSSGACCSIWLATLADGRTVAVGVGYPGVSKEAIAFRRGSAPTPAGDG